MTLEALLDRFSTGLRDIYENTLISVVLYGSAAREGYRHGRSDINILIVLSDASLPNIAKAHRLVNGRMFGDIRPVFFSPTHIETSRDVFPIEFLDMRESYRVIMGKDVLKDIAIDTRHLRFQCEQELKSKLVTLKTAYLRANGRAAVTDLAFKSFTSIMHIMRNMIRLKGAVPPRAQEEIIAAIARDFGMDTAPLRKALEAKRSPRRMGYAEADALLAGLAQTLERAAALVDTL